MYLYFVLLVALVTLVKFLCAYLVCFPAPLQLDLILQQGGLQLFFPFVLGAVHIWNGKQACFSCSIIADTQDSRGKGNSTKKQKMQNEGWRLRL